MSTVYARQYGRLGNNLFQKAAAIGYATRYGLDYDLIGGIRNGYAQHCYNITELGHHFNDLLPPASNDRRSVMLNGYWQSEKYFAHCREEVLKAFGFNWMPVFPETCAIHVRRGDYLNYPDKHPVVTKSYIDMATTYIRRQTGVNHFLFFSDDIEWCKQYAKEDRGVETFDFSESRTELEDLELMSSCQHQIISNSTFSWWAAWLNQNPDKVVISPSKDNWFGPGNAHLDTKDIIPDSWIQIRY